VPRRPVQGLVLECYGYVLPHTCFGLMVTQACLRAGNAPQRKDFLDVLQEACERGVVRFLLILQ